jgi:hypothetical protein
MSGRGLALIGLCLCLAACETGPTPEEIQAFEQAVCDEAGFEQGSDAFLLCLQLQMTNRRIEALERRLTFIELNVRTGLGFYGRCDNRRC